MATASLAERLRKLEERLAHELLGTEERCELEDRVKKLRRKAQQNAVRGEE